MAINVPFKFLDSYTKNDREIFFGRDTEIEELYTKVFQSRLLLVYGASGTGKSSVVNCGLANKFQDSDWLPIHIRKGLDINQSMLKQIFRETITQVRLNPDDKPEKTLFKLLNSVYLDHFKPIYLIFDQFEELFIFGDREEWADFIRSIDFLMGSDLTIHFLFIVRGEYLEYLSEFEDIIPDFFDNRIRIEKMTRKKALECIEGPCRKFSIKLEENFAENLLKKLSPDKAEIELTFLQVFLDRIYRTAETKANGKTQHFFANNQIERLGQIGDVLAEFLDEQIFQMNNPKSTLTVLKSFVSLEGTKKLNLITDVRDFTESLGEKMDPGKCDEIIRELVNRRILREKDEAGRYELRHDSLARKVYEKITIQEHELLDVKQFLTYSLTEYRKRRFLLNDADLAYIEPFEDRLVLDRETREFIRESRKQSHKRHRTRRRFIIIGIVIVILMITSLLGFFYSQQQKKKAEEMASLARDESAKALEQRAVAENQRILAEQKEEEAALQANMAEEQRLKAEISRTEAEKQRVIALQQKQSAEERKLQADKARQKSEISEKNARMQKEIANQERSRALQFRMISTARAMSVKSVQLQDPEQKALVALQAWQFNREFKGNSYDPDIYNALYEARKDYFGDLFNQSRGHEGSVQSIITSGSSIWTTGSDGRILKWKTGQFKAIPELFARTGQINRSLAINPQGTLIATGTDEGYLFIFDLLSGKETLKVKVHEGNVNDIAFMENPLRLISIAEDGLIKSTDLNGHSKLLGKEDQRLNSLSIYPSGSFLLVAANDGKIRRLDPADGSQKEIFRQSDDQATKVTFSHNGHYAAFGFNSGRLILWDVDRSEMVTALSGHSAAVTDIKFGPGDQFLITTGYDRSARVWKLDQLQELPITLSDHQSWVMSAGFTGDGQWVLTGQFDKVLKAYPLDMSRLAAGLCEKIGRNLTQEEWRDFVAKDINYINTCR